MFFIVLFWFLILYFSINLLLFLICVWHDLSSLILQGYTLRPGLLLHWLCNPFFFLPWIFHFFHDFLLWATQQVPYNDSKSCLWFLYAYVSRFSSNNGVYVTGFSALASLPTVNKSDDKQLHKTSICRRQWCIKC